MSMTAHWTKLRALASALTALAAVSLVSACISTPTPHPGSADALGGVDAAPQPDTPADTNMDEGCPNGTWVDVGTERVCVEPLKATETGFQCPPDQFEYRGFGWGGCGPAGIPEDGMEQEVIAQDGLSCGGLKLDVLLVMDSSTSMCDEQNGVAAAIQNFAASLSGYEADMHIAATTVDMECPADATTGTWATQGAFSTHAAEMFPAACYQKERVECVVDADCGDPSDFKCITTMTESCLVNPNGSVNSTCRRLCDTDTECQALYGPRATCLKPGGSSDSGCVVPPDTETCPDSFGPVLTHDDADLLACLATVGVHSNKCFAYEQGLRAAWVALDPNGTQSVQSGAFLRKDAQLAIVFVTDEDDCSTADGQTLTEDKFNTCAFLGDTTSGGPLLPVAQLAEQYKSLKSDPNMVSVLSIAGDSLAEGAVAKQADRDAYVASKADPKVCHQMSHVCTSSSGTADWGSRYQAMTDEFGDRGIFRNICAPEQLTGAFGDLLKSVKDGYLETCQKALQ